MTILTTLRLRLEPFEELHLAGLRVLNSNPEVMRYITGRPETPEETVAVIERVKARWAQWGYSWWAFIEKESGDLIGCGCIQHLDRDAANPLEIGWRLRPDKWGQGFALEAARRMADFAYEKLGPQRLCAVCHPENTPSARVMQRLGMKYRGLERWYERDVSVYDMVLRASEGSVPNTQQHPQEIRLDTDDFAAGAFKPHGRSKIRATGEVFTISSEGPFNMEAVEAVNRTRTRLLEVNPPTKPYAYINVFKGSVLMSPDALAAYDAGLRQAYCGRYMPPSAMAWVFPEGIEGGAIMASHYRKLFSGVDIAFQIFKDADTAQIWVQQMLQEKA